MKALFYTLMIFISSTLFSLEKSELLMEISLKKHIIETGLEDAEMNETRLYYYLQGAYDQLCEIEAFMLPVF